MKVIETKEEIQEEIQLLLKNHKSVGFVPTMGALHRGHLELVERSLAENDVSVCSIFVNPLQFNKKEDLDKYPNRLEDDLKFLEDLGCDFVFTPVASEFYEGVEGTTFEFGILEEVTPGLLTSAIPSCLAAFLPSSASWSRSVFWVLLASLATLLAFFCAFLGCASGALRLGIPLS